MVYTDSQQFAGNIADGSGGATSFPSGDMAWLISCMWLEKYIDNSIDAVFAWCCPMVQHLRYTTTPTQAVHENFVRFCMLQRDGADILAGAFAKEAARYGAHDHALD